MMMMLRPFLMRQQVSQCVRPYQGPFLNGRLLRLLSCWHAGGGDDDDNTVRSGARQTMRRIGAPPRAGWYWRSRCPAPPFLLHFSCRTKEPTPPTIEGRALKSSGATVTASSPIKPPSISKAFLPRWLTVCHRRILRESTCLNKRCFWWGCRIMFPLNMLAARSERVLIRSLLAPATSSLTTLGCVLARMYMASACLQKLQGITPWGWGWTWRRCRFLAVAAAMVAAVLFWPCCCGRRVVCRRLAPAAQFPPCCHGERVHLNEALVLMDSPYAFSAAASIHLAGLSPAMSPLLRPERRMPPESPHRETGCYPSEISWVLTGWSQSPHSCGPWRTWRCNRRLAAGHTAWVYLLVQVGDLGHVPGVLEQDDVSSIQADGPVAGVFVKNILDQMNDGCVIMMGPVREPRTQQVGVGRLHVIDDDQSSGLCGQLLSEVPSPVQQLPRARGLPGQLPVSRLRMTVKNQDTSECPGHDLRGQCH